MDAIKIRRSILNILDEEEEDADSSVERIADELGVPESVVERELEALANQGLVRLVSGRSLWRGRRVFIGHGHSRVWRDLKDLLEERLHLRHEEFNREASAGLPTSERLWQMLDNASFAFLVFTAEDELSDGTKRARENVVHELGLCQGRLGFRRAIVLVEEECQVFSNIDGLGQIRFSKGNILTKSEEIRQVLEREGLLRS